MTSLLYNTTKNYYKVSGKRFLTEEEFADFKSRNEGPYVLGNGDRGTRRLFISDDTNKTPWFDITMVYDNVDAAMGHARAHTNKSLDGGYAIIEKSADQLFRKDKTTVICKIRKENGKIVESVVQDLNAIMNTYTREGNE